MRRVKLPAVECLDNFDGITEKAIRALKWAICLAGARHHRHVAPEHLFWALAQMEPNVGQATLQRLGLDLTHELDRVEALVAAIPPDTQKGEPLAGHELDRLLAAAKVASDSLGHVWVGTEHLVLGMLSCTDNPCREFLSKHGIVAETFRAAVLELLAGR
jgi:ATP-dependent Clp protease ATP-binding subunit ClpC